MEAEATKGYVIELTEEEEAVFTDLNMQTRCPNPECGHLKLFHVDNIHCCSFTYCLVGNCGCAGQ